MSDLLPFIVTGIASGSLVGMAAVGLVLSYRTSGVFNFGHGAVAAAAAYLFYTLYVDWGLPWPLAALLVIGFFSTVVAALLERITSRLAASSQAVAVLATVALLLGINGMLFLAYGDLTVGFPEFLPTSGFAIGEVQVSWAKVLFVVIGAGSAGGLYLFLRVSRLGIAMRAVVDNPSLISLSGQRASRIMFTSWSIATGFAATSGILLAPTLGRDATLLTLLVVQALGACSIGLFSNLPMTYVGGIVIGVASSVATRYFTTQPLSGIPITMPFLVLLAVLVIVPAKKFPAQGGSLRGLIAERDVFSPRTRNIAMGVGLVALLLVPSFSGTKLPLWIAALSAAVILGSLALLMLTSGQVSLCHAAFVAVGASMFSKLLDAGIPWGPSLLAAGLLTVPVGAAVAIPAIRVSGIYLALATLGFGILMQSVVFGSFLMMGTGLIVEASRPEFGPVSTSDTSLYYLYLAIAILCCAAFVGVHKSQLGRLLRGVSESPVMLTTQGLNINVTKVLVFGICAFFAGIGGALTASQIGSVNGASYGPIQSLIFVTVVAIAGTRLLQATVVASLLLVLLPGYFGSFGANEQLLAFGVFGVLVAVAQSRRQQLEEWFERSAAATDRRIRVGPARARRERISTARPAEGGTPA